MTSPLNRRGFDWEGAGYSLGETLEKYYAVVVVGLDPVATGRVAVGIGRAQAMKRRVAVGDLFSESPPIQELVHSDDPHGLVDSFLYGVSLSRIAYEVPGSGQLFVMPSGTEAPDYDEILPNPRWHRLAAGFREVGALLVLAAPANAPHIEQLVAATEGAILVGDAVPRKLPVVAVVSSVRETELGDAAVPEATAKGKKKRKERTGAGRPWSGKRIAAVAGIVLTLGLAAGAAWLAYRPLASSRRDYTGHSRADSAKGPHTPVIAVTPDTAARASVADSTPVATVVAPPINNPQDSAQAAGFAVELMAANTQAGAILKLQKDGKNLAAATFSPVLDSQGSRWFKVIGGAYVDRAGADSLLTDLRKRKVVDAGNGTVVRLPFAFLIDSAVPAAAVPGMVANYADRGQPVYALRQADGTAWLLVGAFESVDQSELYAESLRASGITPVLVYRKGRTF